MKLIFIASFLFDQTLINEFALQSNEILSTVPTIAYAIHQTDKNVIIFIM